MTPFASLLAAVESGKPKLNEFKESFTGKNCFQAHKAFYGSTDAAIEMCEAMLPGVPWAIGVARPDNYYAKIFADKSHPKTTISDTPARALFIATLRALVAMEKTP